MMLINLSKRQDVLRKEVLYILLRKKRTLLFKNLKRVNILKIFLFQKKKKKRKINFFTHIFRNILNPKHFNALYIY